MKRINTLMAISVSLILITNCNTKTKEENTDIPGTSDDRIVLSADQFERNQMMLGSITKKDFPQTITVNGMIDVPPENKAIVNSIMGGYIKSIKLLEGDKVVKGQPLVTVENPEFISLQQAYLEIKEQLTYLNAEYQRQQILYKEEISSQKNFLKAESQYKTALAKYNGLKKQLNLLNISTDRVEAGEISSTTTIFAPISGSISHIHVSKGTFVSPTESILEIVDNSHIHLELSVFEKDILSIKKGQIIHFNIPEISNDSYKATVHLVGKSINEDRTITVHGHPDQENQRFLTGMFVTAEIRVSESPKLVVPEAGVVAVDSRNYILVLDERTSDDYYFRKVMVDAGNTIDDFTEILVQDDTIEGKQILTKGAFGLIGEN